MEIGATSSQSTASGTSESTQQLFEDYEAFLQLLTTQLEHQDPLDPMDTAEYTNQLIQYAIVEQEIAANENLEELIALTASNANTSALQYVGNTAEIDSAYAMKSDGSASWSYSLAEPAAEVSLQVRDGDGRLVYEQSGETGSGKHDFVWDGVSNDGSFAADGTYSLEVVATDDDGEAIDASITSYGEVTGVDTTDGSVVFTVGELLVYDAAILGFESP